MHSYFADADIGHHTSSFGVIMYASARFMTALYVVLSTGPKNINGVKQRGATIVMKNTKDPVNYAYKTSIAVFLIDQYTNNVRPIYLLQMSDIYPIKFKDLP